MSIVPKFDCHGEIVPFAVVWVSPRLLSKDFTGSLNRLAYLDKLLRRFV
jgi:hypothetical protein